MSKNKINDLRPDIRTLSCEEIGQGLAQHGEKKFRARQIYEWLWMNACISFDEMTNIPRPTREFLKTNFTFHTAIAEVEQKSKDGTIKVGFRLYDKSIIEGVLIPVEGRYTACISSQVGCKLGCKFCATGKLGFTRNLTAGEIFDQVTYLSKLAGKIRGPSSAIHHPSSSIQHPASGIQYPSSVIRHLLSNIVFMGMGEPFLNYDQVKKSIEKITSEEGPGMSPQRITVSSIGIPKMIRTMADDNPKYLFAISLHTASDEKRNQIIPFNLSHPLQEIINALKYYHSKTKKRITIEYILFAKFNDSLTDANELALFCRNFPVKINLIEYNPVNETDFIKSDSSTTRAFVNFLEKRNLVVNIRKSRGKDIGAACGQLTANLLKSN